MPPRRRDPDPPDLPAALQPRDVDPLADGDRVELCAPRGLAVGGDAAGGVALEAVLVEDADLSSCRLDRVSLVDVRILGGSLANVASRGSRAVRTEIAGTRLTGLSLPDAELRDVVLRGCRADLSSFARARMAHVRFEDCVLTEADLTDAELRDVDFVDCDLGGADLRGARMSDCVMRGVRLDGLIGADGMRGVALPWADVVGNAATWAQALGLRVLE